VIDDGLWVKAGLAAPVKGAAATGAVFGAL
jgi:hypothetical protein